jgi:Predicted branched-chain amino acid permease (azaleucine resistance)
LNSHTETMDKVGFHEEDSFLQGIKDCIPTLLGYISIGLAFGVVGSASGLKII